MGFLTSRRGVGPKIAFLLNLPPHLVFKFGKYTKIAFIGLPKLTTRQHGKFDKMLLNFCFIAQKSMAFSIYPVQLCGLSPQKKEKKGECRKKLKSDFLTFSLSYIISSTNQLFLLWSLIIKLHFDRHCTSKAFQQWFQTIFFAERTENGPKTDRKRTENGPKTDRKRTKNGPQMNLKNVFYYTDI